jgi:hypothetical protein
LDKQIDEKSTPLPVFFAATSNLIDCASDCRTQMNEDNT